ncbi:MAG: hypothetical protein KDB03_25985 [Planctomycetales bacterium]|nr:hypothetical protein [Planctomycetales bacterium]
MSVSQWNHVLNAGVLALPQNLNTIGNGVRSNKSQHIKTVNPSGDWDAFCQLRIDNRHWVTFVVLLQDALMTRQTTLALAAFAGLMLITGCRTEVGGVTSVNEAAKYWNDPSVVFYPPDEKMMHHTRASSQGSTSSARSELIGRVTILDGDLRSENPTEFQRIEIRDEMSKRAYILKLTSASFAKDLGYNLQGRIAKIRLDVELPPESNELDDDHILSFGPLR